MLSDRSKSFIFSYLYLQLRTIIVFSVRRHFLHRFRSLRRLFRHQLSGAIMSVNIYEYIMYINYCIPSSSNLFCNTAFS